MKYLLLGFFFSLSLFSFSQNNNISQKDSVLLIDDIIVTGNKKTNTNIILREMFIKKGDSVLINELPNKIELSRQYVFNTTLFIEVKIHTAKSDSNKITVIVEVKERWYLFPLPHFELVDRNFNEWWVNQNRDLSRVNYGIKFLHNNVTGNNDKLNIWLITGYNRQVNLRYEIPFINKKMTNGFNIGFVHSKQRELNYQTSLTNKQQFFKLTNNFARTQTRFDIALTHRPDKFIRHAFRVGYTDESVDDSIIIKNSNYYGNNATSIKFFDFTYSLQYFKTNYIAYPTNGVVGNLSLYLRGFSENANYAQLSTSIILALPISQKWFIRTQTNATIKLPYNDKFIYQRIFGFGNFQLRGLENYVIDGMAAAMNRTTMGYELFNFNVKLPIKSKIYEKIPFKFYPKIHYDIGYCYNPYINNNLFNNKFLYTYGFGLDIVTIYDLVLRFEYSFNQLGTPVFVIGVR